MGPSGIFVSSNLKKLFYFEKFYYFVTNSILNELIKTIFKFESVNVTKIHFCKLILCYLINSIMFVSLFRL